MRGIILVTLPLLASYLLFGTPAQSQDLSGARTKCVQFGFKENTKDHDECVKQFLKASTQKPPPPSELQREDKFWEDVLATGNREAFEAYLKRYPIGLYTDLAKAKILRLGNLPESANSANRTLILKVAIDPTYEPFTFKTADGQPTGFDVDIANALCEQIKRKCMFVEQVWESMIPGLNAKKYDLIISSMSITDDRMKEVDFTDKYYNTPSRIVLKKTVKYTDPASIKGKKIGVLKGSTQEAYALGELKPVGVLVYSYEAQDQVYLDIKAGRLDGTVTDYMEVTGGFLNKPEGEKYALVGPDLREPRYFGYGAGIALRKGEGALKGELNAAIKTIRSSGRYKAINDKYFAKFNIDVYGE